MGRMWTMLEWWLPAERRSSSILRGAFDRLWPLMREAPETPRGNRGIADRLFQRPRSQPGGQEEREARDRLRLTGATLFLLVLGGSLRR